MSEYDRTKRASLREVAALAGVSVATASRALTRTGYIAPETLARVLDAAAHLEYRPNLRARDLRRRASCCIGLIIPNLLNAYYTSLADAISQLLGASAYQLLLASTRDDAATERAIVDDMIGQDVAGLLWVPSNPDAALLDLLRSHSIPAVSVVRRVPGDTIDTVVLQDFEGSRAATQHLLDLGHRRIGYIGSRHHSSNLARWQGYLQAFADAHAPADPELAKLSVPTSDWGETAATELVSMSSPPTAIYAASNALMSGVTKAVRVHRVRVPEEMSLICFDDVDWFSFSQPPITAVRTSHTALAETAVGLLLDRIGSQDWKAQAPSYQESPYELIVRSSTTPPGLSKRA